MANFKPAKMARFNAEPVGNFLSKLVTSSRNLSAGLTDRAVSRAWCEASGAAEYTAAEYFKDNVFHVTLKSSVLRSRIAVLQEAILQKMNEILKDDEVLKSCGLAVKVEQIKMH